MLRRDAIRLTLASVLFVTLGVGALRLRSTREGSAPPSASSAGAAIVEWCAPGLEPIAGGGCFAPSTNVRAAPVVLYLHGRYEASAPADELDRQARVAKEANKRGFSVLALRGEIGACQRPDLATWYCWPSNERTADAGPSFVARWSDALAEVARRGAAAKRYVLGFSNGAYFAGLLATRGWFDAAAFVVAAGGPTEPIARAARMPPILLLTGDDDPSADDTIRFARELTREGWPNDIYSREGSHMLTDGDIREALTFFERAEHEAVPLAPPLAARRPRPASARDAAAAASSETEADAAVVAEESEDAAAP